MKNPLKNIQLIHPVSKQKWSFGQRASDKLTVIMGSWGFILFFLLFLVVWIIINGYYLVTYNQTGAFDPYPFILLNLALSCLAAIQAPIILMSQNREAQKDRLRAEYDYKVNRKAEKEIQQVQLQLIDIEKLLKKK